MRYLIDTNVLVSALRSRRGASHAVLRRVFLGELPIVMHPKLLWEYRDVLGRQEIAAALTLSPQEVESLLAYLVHIASEVNIRYLWRPNLRDEGDNFVIEIAVAAAPCTVVTYNTRDFSVGELRFPDVILMTPKTLLQRLPG